MLSELVMVETPFGDDHPKLNDLGWKKYIVTNKKNVDFEQSKDLRAEYRTRRTRVRRNGSPIVVLQLGT